MTTKPREESVTAGPEGFTVGGRVLDGYRIEQELRAEVGAARVFLADDERRSEYVLLVMAQSEEAFEYALAGPAAGRLLRRSRLASLWIAVVELNDEHLGRFGKELFAAPPERSTKPNTAGLAGRLRSGDRFAGRYVVEAPLGRGGMGEVYSAYDGVLHRRVALKLLRVDALNDPEARAEANARLLREARVVCGLRHPNIVELFDAGNVDDIPYLVLELCEGGSLRAIMSRGTASDADRTRWLEETARGLAFAHSRGIAHRDVKPENILVDAKGVAKVSDFGIAKALDGRGAETFSIIGTPLYMAPEQLMGARADGRADQFAWALLAEELLTGVHPRSAARGEGLGQRPESLPPAFTRVLARATSLDADARFTSFDELLDELRCVAASSRAVSPSQVQARRVVPRLKRASASLAGIGLAAFLAVSLGWSRAGAPPAAATTVVHGPTSIDESRAASLAFDERGPEAHAALTAGLQLWNDASTEASRRRFSEVLAKFPSTGAAHLYYSASSEWIDADFRFHIREAAALRGTLSARDSDLLRALEPLIKEPPDYSATTEALARLTDTHPSEPLLWRSRATHGVRARDPRDVLAVIGRVDGANAFWLRARALLQLDLIDEARAVLHECAATGPRSVDCLDLLTRLELNEGRCASAASLAKRLIASDPTLPLGYAYLARAEIGAKHSTDSARAIVLERLTHTPPEQQEEIRLRDEFFLQVYDGRFDEALAAVTAWERAVSGVSDAASRMYPLVCRIDLELELGMTARAADTARRFQASSEVWLRNDYVDLPVEVTRALYLTGLVDRAAFETRRAHNELIMQRRGGYFASPGIQWFETYAQMSRTAEDAREALERLPDERPTIEAIYRDVGVDEEIGRNYLLTGRDAEAIPHLRRATSSCNYLKSIHYVRAHRFLGDALASSDKSAACEAYKRVIERWGRATRSVSARASRTAMHRLRCPE